MHMTAVVLDDPNHLADIRKALRDSDSGSVPAVSMSTCRELLTKKDIHCLMTWRTQEELDGCMALPTVVKWQEGVKKIAPKDEASPR